MSWKLGFILLQARWQKSEADLLEELGFSDLPEPQKIHIGGAIKMFPSTTSVAVSESFTMVLNGLLVYDLSYNPPFSSDLDGRLKHFSKTAPVLAGFMDGVTSTYGFCIFEDGKVLRARQIISGKLKVNYGKPFAEEEDADNEEARIFALTARWLGEPLFEYFFDPAFNMNAYKT
jgi:hypothetical protein